MNQDEFTSEINRLLSPVSDKTIDLWIGWIKECVDMEQYADFTPKPNDVAINEWYDSYYATLYFIKKDYGSNIANQIWELATINACIYPHEMKDAAKYLTAGGDAKLICQMINEDYFDNYEKPPTMDDVYIDRNSQKKKSTTRKIQRQIR